MKKMILAVVVASFVILNAVGSDQQAHKKQKTEEEVPETSLTEASGLDDYAIFKATEQTCEITEQAVHTILKNIGVNPVAWIGSGRMWSRNEQILQMHAGLLTQEFNEFYTPWGLKKMHTAFDSSISQEISQEAQKKLIVAFYCKSSYQTTYKVLEVDGKKLPEPIERDSKDYLKIAVVKESLKKHQERYQKETTDQIISFIPVRSVAEMVTAYLIRKDD